MLALHQLFLLSCQILVGHFWGRLERLDHRESAGEAGAGACGHHERAVENPEEGQEGEVDAEDARCAAQEPGRNTC